MIFEIIGLVIGILIFVAGLYYFRQEKNDSESRKIYTITMAAGAVIVVGIIVKIIALGL